jgi:hypothetical protein
MTDLDGRHRDADGRISQRRADTKLGTLRKDYAIWRRVRPA